jgi:hypothetical protein
MTPQNFRQPRRSTWFFFMLGLCMSVGMPGVSQGEGLDSEDALFDAMFQPFWTGSVAWTHLGQGSEQVSNNLSANLTRVLSETGSDVYAGLTAGRQKQEGKDANLIGLDVGGGWGVGDFKFSGSAGAQVGNMRTRNLSLGGTVEYTAWDVLTLGVGGSVNPQVHEGTILSLLTGSYSARGETRLYSRSDVLNLFLSYSGPWDWLSWNLSASRSWNKTLRIESGRWTRRLDSTGRGDSLEFGPTFLYKDHWSLGLAWSGGKDLLPPFGYYNPRTGQTASFGKAATVWYRGFVTSLSYQF